MEQNILSFYELNILKLSFSFFLMWTIFEVFFEFVTMLFLFYVLCFVCFPLYGMWDFCFLTQGPTGTPCIGRQSVNHWTTREVPHS